ncbi:NADP-dependent leukotriene B4 12-hydroxydehydrogenase [Trichoderma harzianum]|uniref:NADP-dependent leukotriene B4 12-hydroxydehydrogenase n=1 Tax=Trichoderma harzianum TaxID=5544 RepID=A0A0F9WWY5_TRIHA|nr:NADP-dependent leukotriene B4 12-hydroxydehydrogenase [Trichoderma harzianum]
MPVPTEKDLNDGQVLAETLYISLDPAMRGYTVNIYPDRESYFPPVQVGETMKGPAIVRIIASKSSKAQAGDIVTGWPGWQELAVLNDNTFDAPFPLPPNGRVSDLMGVLGLTGLTAYYGIEKIADVHPGETVVVSGAAGATGSVAGQIAKIKGARVIGIAGSEDKVRWLKNELGFDEALNYKDKNFAQKFEEVTPDLIDVYWDNVGGEILDLALGRAQNHARFVMLQGFIVLDFAAENLQARTQLSQWIAEGKLSRKETIIKGGLGAAERGLLDLFYGRNIGKLLVEIKDPSTL